MGTSWNHWWLELGTLGSSSADGSQPEFGVASRLLGPAGQSLLLPLVPPDKVAFGEHRGSSCRTGPSHLWSAESVSAESVFALRRWGLERLHLGLG